MKKKGNSNFFVPSMMNRHYGPLAYQVISLGQIDAPKVAFQANSHSLKAYQALVAVLYLKSFPSYFNVEQRIADIGLGDHGERPRQRS